MARGGHSRKQHYPPCPDGGWGWMVVFGSFMIHVISDGVIYSFGLLYYEIDKHFVESKAVTSMVVSLMTGTTYCIGPIASALTIKYGCRIVTCLGAMFAAFGFFMSIFASNIYVLYFTLGICFGIGAGLMYLPAIVIVTSYFERKRAFATGIAVCGSGIGTAIMSLLIEHLISSLGWRGAMGITSAILLLCCLFGALFKPVPIDSVAEEEREKAIINVQANEIELNENVVPVPVVAEEDKKNEEDEDGHFPEETSLALSRLSLPHESNNHHHGMVYNNSEGDLAKKSACSVQIYVNGEALQETETKQRSHSFSPGLLYRKDIFYSGSLMNISNYSQDSDYQSKPKTKADCFLLRWLDCSDEIMDTFFEMIDLSLLKNYIFLIFLISNFMTSVGFHIPYIYLKDRIVELKLDSEAGASSFNSIIGISSTVSRLVFGYISDHSFVNRLWLYMVSVTVSGIAIMLNPLATTYEWMVVFCAVYGITYGTYVSLTSVILVDLLSLEKLTNAFGLILLFQGVASMIGPVLVGFTYDYYGSHAAGYYLTGAIVALSGIMLVLIEFAHFFKSFKKNLTI